MATQDASKPFPLSPEVAEQTFIQRVYNWMGAGLALTGLIAYWASTQIALMQMLMGGLFWILVLAELGIVIWLSAMINKISAQAATIGFLVYSALNGLTLSYIFLVYTGASIASTFFIAAGTFASVSMFGWMTKTNLTSLGGYFLMALIGLIIASVVNFFVKSTIFDLILSYAGVGLFIGLTAYDTQKLKQIHQNGLNATHQTAIMGALALYLDFINMFLYLLRIFGKRK